MVVTSVLSSTLRMGSMFLRNTAMISLVVTSVLGQQSEYLDMVSEV
jgi:hypothetical protein